MESTLVRKAADLFPNNCGICGKYQIQKNYKKFYPHKVLTYNAVKAIKLAAKNENEQLYSEIKEKDLIANEFQVHKCCYSTFTFGYEEDEGEGETSSTESRRCYDQGDFEKVVSFIKKEVLDKKTVVSLNTIHDLYGIGIGDSRYRSRLKGRLEKEFRSDIIFLSSTNPKKTAEMVMSSECIGNSVQINHPEYLAAKAGKLLREEIFKKFEGHKMQNWPPSIDELSKDEWKPPEIVENFVEALLCPSSSPRTQKQKRWVKSLSNDIVYQVLGGKVMQLKQLVLALGLSNLTGSRKVIDILSSLGHCLPYDITTEIKTAAAESAIAKAESQQFLPITPTTEHSIAPTFYWVDNFDVIVDRLAGGSSVNTTHLMAFQETNTDTCKITKFINVGRRKSRKLTHQAESFPVQKVNPKQGPPSIFRRINPNYSDNNLNHYYFI